MQTRRKPKGLTAEPKLVVRQVSAASTSAHVGTSAIRHRSTCRAVKPAADSGASCHSRAVVTVPRVAAGLLRSRPHVAVRSLARARVCGMDVCAHEHLFVLKVRASGATSTVTSALSLGRRPSGSAAEPPSAAPRAAPPRRTSAVGAAQRPIALPKGARLRCATQRAAQTADPQNAPKARPQPAGRAACLLSRRCRRWRQDRRRTRPSPPAHRGGTWPPRNGLRRPTRPQRGSSHAAGSPGDEARASSGRDVAGASPTKAYI
jgi:hypothetical protein